MRDDWVNAPECGRLPPSRWCLHPGMRGVLPIVMKALPAHTRSMRSDRFLIAVGGVCLLVGASTALAGSSSFPLATLGLLVAGAVLLVIGLERARKPRAGRRPA